MESLRFWASGKQSTSANRRDRSEKRNDVMGEIVFEGDPPYARLDALSAEAHPTPDGVELF